MNSIIIPSLSSCSICENLFWETREELGFVISSFYLWLTQWQNTFWTSLPLLHMLCFWFCGVTHTKQASFPREKCLEGQRSACAAGLYAVRTLTWAPVLTFGRRVLRGQERIITWSDNGLGPFFWNEHQHWRFSYEALTKPPFQSCLSLAKEIHLDNGKEIKVISRRWDSNPFLLDRAVFWYRLWVLLYVIKVE